MCNYFIYLFIYFVLCCSFSNAFVRVTIERSETLYHISNVVGWIYFLAWSISFYPQIYSNYKRKSVVGLNFDFLSLNIVGFFMYALFNCGLYWIPEVEVSLFITLILNSKCILQMKLILHFLCFLLFSLNTFDVIQKV